MGSISKHYLNPSTSNEETHHHHHRPEKFKGENHGSQAGVVVRRFYECNFCKRGFTNAQALGGHMNIHRKDKDRVSNNKNNHKVKLKTSKNSISKSGDDHDEEEYKNHSSICRYEDQIMDMDCFRFINYVPSANYSSSNPNFLRLGFDYSDQSNDSTANLSIQIDQHSYYSNIQEDTSEGRENELDLELRLG